LTGRKWNNIVTQVIEGQWLEKMIISESKKRFAICVNEKQVEFYLAKNIFPIFVDQRYDKKNMLQICKFIKE